MTKKTTIIAWTDHTVNFWMGCFKGSPGWGSSSTGGSCGSIPCPLTAVVTNVAVATVKRMTP